MLVLQVSEFCIQDIQDIVTAYLLIHFVSNLQHGPFAAVTEAVIAFQDYLPLQVMVFQVFLNHLECLFVTAAETGTPHANLNLFSNQHHWDIASKLIKTVQAIRNL